MLEKTLMITALILAMAGIIVTLSRI